MPRTAEQLSAVANALSAMLKGNGHTPAPDTEDEYGEAHDEITRYCTTCQGGMTAKVYDDRVVIHGLEQRCNPESEPPA